MRGGDDGFGEFDGPVEAIVRHVADGGSADGAVPAALHGVVEEDAHEAVVEADGPALGGRHAGQDGAGEVEPAGDEGGAGGFGCWVNQG